MKKILLFAGILAPIVFLSGCSLKKAPAALQITTTPTANVFVDGKLLGKTPYQGSNWKPGEISLKLIPESVSVPLASWEGKIKMSSGILTLIEREFAASDNESSGQILSLEKIKDKKSAGLSVISDPDGALINVDGEAKGFAPLLLDKIGVGDHQIVVTKEGYREKTIRAKAVAGFKLVVNVKLGQKMEGVVASPSGTLTPSPTPTGKATKTSPTPRPTSSKPTPTGISTGTSQVLIKETPTGWLRVRQEATTSSAEVAKVNPGETYSVLEEKTGWFKIEYEPGKEGWISSQYATKQ